MEVLSEVMFFDVCVIFKIHVLSCAKDLNSLFWEHLWLEIPGIKSWNVKILWDVQVACGNTRATNYASREYEASGFRDSMGVFLQDAMTC